MVVNLPVFLKDLTNFSDLYCVCYMCLIYVPNLSVASMKVSVWPIMPPLSDPAPFVTVCFTDV